MKKLIARLLRITRAKHHLSQEKLSAKLGFKRSNYSRCELTGVMSAEHFMHFICLMDVSKDELYSLVKEYKNIAESEEREKSLKEMLISVDDFEN